MKRHMTALRRGKDEHGQVLMLAVVALVLVVIAALLLFDVQNVISGKIKGQNGVDAAALTGAEWQKHSLNLIGELNLIRATGTLISDPFLAPGVEDIVYSMDVDMNGQIFEIPDYRPGPTELEAFTRFPSREEFNSEDENENVRKLIEEVIRVEREISYLANLDDLVSQLQTRISFVGPLIGFGAAQQAAKNNGLLFNGEQNDANETFAEYLKLLRENNEFYNNEEVQFVNDYYWHGPYLNMLYSILGYDGSGGIAAGTKFEFLGMPVFSSDSSSELSAYLGNKYFYQHILGRNWCALDPVLKLDFSGNWWNDFRKAENNDFSRQSEILPLHITFIRGSHELGRVASPPDEFSPYNTALGLGAFDSFARDDELFSSIFNSEVPFDYEVEYTEEYEPAAGNVRKKNYNSVIKSFGTFNDRDAGRRYNLLPLLSWATFDDEWMAYGDYQKEWAKDCLRGSGFQEGMDYQSGALAFFESKQPMRTISSSGSVGRPRSGSYTDRIETNAEAKPIGRIRTENGQYLRPFEAGGLILPVFTKTALIPIALEQVRGISMGDIDWFYYLTEFVPLLSESPTLDDAWERASNTEGYHSGRYMSYYQALKLLDDPAFRKRGLDWLDSPSAWARDANGNRYPIRTHRDDCHVTGGGSQPTFSLH